jgi:hydroxymethylglutaryl-CoA lyase
MSAVTSPLRSRLPDAVTIVEVGPRDGLQNEQEIVPTEVKVEFIERLGAAGLKVVEATCVIRSSFPTNAASMTR